MKYLSSNQKAALQVLNTVITTLQERGVKWKAITVEVPVSLVKYDYDNKQDQTPV